MPYNQADQNLVKSMPSMANMPGTPERLKTQNTSEKNHRFQPGDHEKQDQDHESPLLDRVQ